MESLVTKRIRTTKRTKYTTETLKQIEQIFKRFNVQELL